MKIADRHLRGTLLVQSVCLLCMPICMPSQRHYHCMHSPIISFRHFITSHSKQTNTCSLIFICNFLNPSYSSCMKNRVLSHLSLFVAFSFITCPPTFLFSASSSPFPLPPLMSPHPLFSPHAASLSLCLC